MRNDWIHACTVCTLLYTSAHPTPAPCSTCAGEGWRTDDAVGNYQLLPMEQEFVEADRVPA